MATPHLTSDNASAVTSGATNALASVAMSSSAAAHLVVIRQSTAWDGKSFVVTPDAARWGACMATGIEVYPNTHGTLLVYNDTKALIDAVGTKMNSISWRTGFHPCVNAFIRGSSGFGPYSHRSGVATNPYRAEYVHSAVAYRFKLHRLHFSKMTSFTAYMRVYVPSIAQNWNGGSIYDCTLENVALLNGASKICCKLSTSLPTLAADVAEGNDEWEINGAANNGMAPSAASLYHYHSVAYNPYHGDDCHSMPVWTANQRSASPTTASPTMYYHDFAVANADNVALLKKNPAEVWSVMHFKRANAFAPNSAQALGLLPNYSINAWFYRADLVLSCTSAKIS